MGWTVRTLNATVDAEIAGLPVSLSARLIRLMEMIERVGLEQLHEPHAKHLEGKLWELRVKTEAGIARGIYVTSQGRRIVILRVFQKKSQKTPAREIEIARQRMKQVRL